MKEMNEYDMQEYIKEALHFSDAWTGEMKSIRPFCEAHLLSKNMGLVLTLADGAEFQVTVVKTKLAELSE